MAIYNGGLSIKNVSIGAATGSGNAITSLSADGNVITPDRGSTFITAQGRIRRNITNDLTNLTTAIAEQNLEKYGYKIGDYFIGPSGYQYNLADMDSYYGGYNTFAIIETHHCGIVVDTKSTCQWKSGDGVAVYCASDLHAFLKGTVLNNIKNDMISLFGGTTGLEHLLPRTELDNAISGWGTTWEGLRDIYICALSEVQIYGRVFSADGYQVGTSCKKLELYSKYRFNEIVGKYSVWLRSLCSTAAACVTSVSGYADFAPFNEPLRACGLILFH